jgi:hypothetical protein
MIPDSGCSPSERMQPHEHDACVEEHRPRVCADAQRRRRALGVTSIYLQGIDPGEIIETIHARRPPMIPAGAGLDLQRR